jgi:acetyl esterase/lipase
MDELMHERVCHLGIPFAESVRRDLKLDLYLPQLPPGAAPPPVVVYMHGGGWVQGIRSGPSGVAFALELSAEGWAFASIDYRLAPAHPAPAAIEDAKLAVRFIRSRAAEWIVDAERIVAMGNSAGGHLAAMLGLTRPEDGMEGEGLREHSSAVAGVVDLCGITDIAALLSDEHRKPWAALWVPGEGADQLRRAARFSPLTYASRGGCRFMVAHGEEDASVPFDQAQRFVAALRSGGTPCEFLRLPGTGHQLGVTASVPVQQALRSARREFLGGFGGPAARGGA